MMGTFGMMRSGEGGNENPARGSGRGWVFAILSFGAR
jgi:hypothetical protein